MEDADSENGPLLVLPGSHRLPLLDRDAMARTRYDDLAKIPDVDDGLWALYQESVQEECRRHGLVPQEVHVQKGDTIIWHPLLAHGGTPIADKSRTRLSLVIHTTPKGVPVFRTDVFFDVQRPVSSRAGWSYEEMGGRPFVSPVHFSIGHAHPEFDFTKLR